jgi:hypothetical protein
MQLVIDLRRGSVRCLYAEPFELTALGRVTIDRASYVEPNAHAQWQADLTPVGGPRLGPFLRRSEALAAELHWLAAHWLTTQEERPAHGAVQS